MPYLEREKEIKIHYDVWGEGFPLIFLHGLGQNNYTWFYQIPKFSAQFQCVAIEARGHGRSSKPKDVSYSILSMASDDLAVLEALGIKKAILIGNSMGGMRLLQLNLLAPEFVAGNAIISTGTNLQKYFNPHIILAGIRNNYFGAIKLVLKGAYSERSLKLRPDLYQLHVETHLNKWNFPAHVLLAAYEDPAGVFNWNIEALLSEIKTPTLLVVGAEDKLINVKINKFLAQRLPNCELVIENDQAHMCHLEDFMKFNQRLETFVTKILRR